MQSHLHPCPHSVSSHNVTMTIGWAVIIYSKIIYWKLPFVVNLCIPCKWSRQYSLQVKCGRMLAIISFSSVFIHNLFHRCFFPPYFMFFPAFPVLFSFLSHSRTVSIAYWSFFGQKKNSIWCQKERCLSLYLGSFTAFIYVIFLAKLFVQPVHLCAI